MRSNNRNSEKSRATRKLRLESLESREMLAGYQGATLDTQLAPFVVTTLQDVVANDGNISLREAIASVTEHDQTQTRKITFAPEIAGGTITFNSTMLIQNRNVEIDAWTLSTQANGVVTSQVEGHRGVTISNAGISFDVFNATCFTVETSQDYAFQRNGKTPYQFSTTMRGLKITDGVRTAQYLNDERDKLINYDRSQRINKNDNGYKDVYDGAAIRSLGSQIHINNCNITGITYGKAGVVTAEASLVVLTNTSITDNIAVDDRYDPEYCAGVAAAGSEVYVFNCTIANNKSYDSSDGTFENHGIFIAQECQYITGDYYFTPKAMIYNSIIVNNTLGQKGSDNGKTELYGADRNCSFYVHDSILGRVTKSGSNGNTKMYYETLTGGYEQFPMSGSTVVWPADNKLGTVTYYNGQSLFLTNSYMPAPGGIANNTSDMSVVNNTTTYAQSQRASYNNTGATLPAVTFTAGYNGYDRAGGDRSRGVTALIADIGALESIQHSIIVTIEADEHDHPNDFNADGTPNRISLRDAYDYVGRYYAGGALNHSDWNAYQAAFVYDPQSVRASNIIKFANGVENCVLNAEIASAKTYTIQGTNLGGVGVTVHGNVNKADPGLNIAASNAVRAFNVQSGAITANNFSFANTLARASQTDTTSAAYGLGGAVYVANGAKYIANGGNFDKNYAAKSGGAVYVAAGGTFEGTAVALRDNQSIRGGAIANLGTLTLKGANTFDNNIASVEKFGTPDPAKSYGFGGAIYNAGAGTVMIGTQGQTPVTTFSNNKANSSANPGALLKGGSGGAVYVSAGSFTVYNADFTGNTASKYGGAISNFAVLNVYDSNFTSNISGSGGALQTSGTATLTATTETGVTFANNDAVMRDTRLTADGQDFGGNGGAIFASGAGKSLKLKGKVTFSGNTADNAGGAIDFISGSLEFDGTNATFHKNGADVIGGAIVAAKGIDFSLTGTSFDFGEGVNVNTSAYYAPTLAVTVDVSDTATNLMAQRFFGTLAPTGNLLDTFTRYGSLISGATLTFSTLANSFLSIPTALFVKIDNATDFVLWGQSASTVLSPGAHVVRYYDPAQPGVNFRMNIYVDDATQTSVLFSQLDLGEHAYISSNEYAAGVSLRVYSSVANPIPVKTWTISWGDGTTQSVDSYGFTCNAYHVYSNAGKYDITLTTTDFNGNTNNYGGTAVGYCSVVAPASGAVLQEELFADENLLDELFVEF